jgi:hypothetical protein
MYSQTIAQETNRQNTHTTSPISEHQVPVICEGKHWNVMG